MREEELGRIAYKARVYQQQGEALGQQIAVLQESANDIRISIETLKHLGEAKKKILLPIGSGILLHAEKIDQRKVLVNIGANIVVEKTAEEAVEILEKRLKRIGEAQQSVQKGLDAISAKLQKLEEEAKRITAEMGRDVRLPKE